MSELKLKQVSVIDVGDWDNLVSETYGRVYNFQQQDDCKDRGTYEFSVPVNKPYDYDNATVPEEVNHPDMGVSFAAWLARDPKQKLDTDDEFDREHGLEMWWERNFYPCVDMVINDLHAKGLLPEGKYMINIDW